MSCYFFTKIYGVEFENSGRRFREQCITKFIVEGQRMSDFSIEDENEH